MQMQSAVAVMKTCMDRPEMEQNTKAVPTVRWTPASDVFRTLPVVNPAVCGLTLDPGEQLGHREVDIPSAMVVSLVPGKDLGF